MLKVLDKNGKVRYILHDDDPIPEEIVDEAEEIEEEEEVEEAYDRPN